MYFLENYYLLALIFTLAYALTFIYFLQRFDADDPKIKAFKRVLLGAVGWSLFDFLMSSHFSAHKPEEALAAFRWMSCLFLFYPPASCEFALTLIGRTARLERALVYVPFALLYVAAIGFPSSVDGSTFGIVSPDPGHTEIWNHAFRWFTMVYVVLFLVLLLARALRIKDRLRKREMLIIFTGGVLSASGIVTARQLMVLMGPGFPFMGSIAVVFTCLAAFLGTKLYGRLVSPRILYQAMLNASPNGILRIKHNEIVWMNEAMLKLLGEADSEEMMGRSLESYIDPARHKVSEINWLVRQLNAGQLKQAEIALLSHGEKPLWCLASASLLDPTRPGLGVFTVFSDITSRKETEEQRILGEKLKAAIETAGAVCHEMNQPLQVLTARLDLMLMQTGDQAQLRKSLEDLQDQVRRLADITRRLIKLTKYRTKAYADGEDILDLDRSAS